MFQVVVVGGGRKRVFEYAFVHSFRSSLHKVHTTTHNCSRSTHRVTWVEFHLGLYLSVNPFNDFASPHWTMVNICIWILARDGGIIEVYVCGGQQVYEVYCNNSNNEDVDLTVLEEALLTFNFAVSLLIHLSPPTDTLLLAEIQVSILSLHLCYHQTKFQAIKYETMFVTPPHKFFFYSARVKLLCR